MNGAQKSGWASETSVFPIRTLCCRICSLAWRRGAGVELVLEPMAFPPARVYQKALFDAGFPATAFTTQNIAAEFDRLRKLGAIFRTEPTEAGPTTAAQF
jgi:hypothetical protein